ncbi:MULTISPECIES: hypothetical protein [Paenibacillus]|uniref:hypothetical protein n=1 Tax=Paenibacillus TaxID=44249 RepID=UPI001C64E7E7|nr:MULTISPECIES: hypothetical protein [Paenibacillus]QYK67521.1 hypothetical protein KAI36_02671 [Paenibacillus sp. S02]
MSVLLIQIDENDFMEVKELITRNYAGAKVITVNQLPGDTDWLLSMTEIPDLLDRLINTAGEPAVQRVLHYKLFRKHFGLAPGMYRQKIRNERQASR